MLYSLLYYFAFVVFGFFFLIEKDQQVCLLEVL